jgi:hypothetical protein
MQVPCSMKMFLGSGIYGAIVPVWTPRWHFLFPQSFRQGAQMLILGRICVRYSRLNPTTSKNETTRSGIELQSSSGVGAISSTIKTKAQVGASFRLKRHLWWNIFQFAATMRITGDN